MELEITAANFRRMTCHIGIRVNFSIGMCPELEYGSGPKEGLATERS